MKQSIRPTRATLYFQFMTLRDLNPSLILSEQEPRLKECSKNGHGDMVKLTLADVSAFTAYCNSKKTNGFRWKGSCFMVRIFVQIQTAKTQLRVHV